MNGKGRSLFRARGLYEQRDTEHNGSPRVGDVGEGESDMLRTRAVTVYRCAEGVGGESDSGQGLTWTHLRCFRKSS